MGEARPRRTLRAQGDDTSCALANGSQQDTGCGRSKRFRTSAPWPPAPRAPGSLTVRASGMTRSAWRPSLQTAPCAAKCCLSVRPCAASSALWTFATVSTGPQVSCYDLSSGVLKCKLAGHAVLRGDLATLTCLAASGRSSGGLFVGDTAGKVSLMQNMPGLAGGAAYSCRLPGRAYSAQGLGHAGAPCLPDRCPRPTCIAAAAVLAAHAAPGPRRAGPCTLTRCSRGHPDAPPSPAGDSSCGDGASQQLAGRSDLHR